MTKLEIMQLSQGLSNLYTGLETDLIANIAEYLAGGNIDSPTAQWKIQMLAQLGALDKANIATIAQYARIAPEMLTEALETAALNAIEELEPGFQNLVKDGIISGTDVPVEDTMARALISYNKQAKQSLNMVNTVMRYKAKEVAQKIVNDTAELAEKQSFLDMLNKATGKAVTGAESRQAAMRQCIKEMSEKGIPAFVDKRGREWSPEAYINMDIRTTVSNVAHQAQIDRMEDYGVDLVEVSSHAGARPKCAQDQGKIFNRKNKDGYSTDLHGRKIRYYSWKRSSYGEPDGLLGINCGHQIYPFFPGLSYQTYFPYDEYDNQEQYKKTQNQRELERRVRKSKRECMMLEQTGDTEGLQKAKETLKTRQKALKQYCADNDLKYKPDRTAVVDYKKSVAGFTPTDKKSRIAEIKAKTVDKSGGSGIIEEREELPKKMKSGSYAVDWEKVQSDEYSQKFVKLSKDERISSAIETRAKWALSNRDGKNTEELYALSMLDGHEISRITNQNYNSAVKRTAAFTKKLSIADEAEERILLIHNHPKGLPPSISDINALLKNKNIEGITVGHNGSVYLYTKPKTAIPSDEWIVAMKHFKDFSEETAMEKSLEILSRKFGFNIQKL